MNIKRWLVVAIAIIFIVASGISSIGLSEPSEDEEEFAFGNFNPYAILLGNSEPQPEVIEPGSVEERIIVIPIEGQIGVEATGYHHEVILSAIEQVRTDDSIKAILLDVDTPGGAVYHTHEVYSELMELKEELDIPVYASMGSMAASGGYYVSMAADHIFASPHTITGSIGVIMSNYDVSGLMDDLGIKSNVIKSGEMKDIMSSSREMTEEEKEVLQAHIDESFNEFISVIETGRTNLSRQEIENLADGRIYSGNQAQEEGLIDELGYFKDALETLRTEEGLEEAEVFQFVGNESMNLFSGLPFGLGQSSETDVPGLIKDIEDAQAISIDYIWEGAPSYEQ